VGSMLLLEHRLLALPYRSKGLRWVQENLKPEHPSVAEGGHPARPSIHLQAAGFAASLLAKDCRDLVTARIAQVLDLEVVVVEGCCELAEVPHDRVAASVHLGLGKSRVFAELDLRVEEIKLGIGAVLIDRRDDFPEGLHVLPRHRYSRSPAASRASALLP